MEESNVDKVIVKLGFKQENGEPLTYEYAYPDFKKGIQIKQPDGVQIVFVSRYSDFKKFDIIVQILESATSKSVGNVIAVIFIYKDKTKEYISSVVRSSSRAINTLMMIGDRTERKNFEQIVSQESWRGMPAIGSVSDYVTITMAVVEDDEPIPLPPDPPDPPNKESESKPEEPKPPIIIEPEVVPESPTFRPDPPIEGKAYYLNKVRRNARYRGPRESDKEFLNHEEARLDIINMNRATSNIILLVKQLMQKIENKGDDIQIESSSPIILQLERAINSVDVAQHANLDESTKRIINKIAEVEGRIDYYGKIVHEKS